MSNPENPGLYVHVPFCRTKCPYCDFCSVTTLSRVPEWREALLQEILLYRDRYRAFDSLYLGGGTPSVLGLHDLETLFESLFRYFTFLPDAEITIEANPDDVTPEKLDLLNSLGVTRISLGVQSFDSGDLEYLGRRHTALQTEGALDRIREAGFAGLSVDLIYGLPEQRISGWMRTLTRALDFRPEHLSCYQLTIHDETPFGGLLAEGRISPPGEENERAFFLRTAGFLEESGYIHYEVSNFARGEAHIARHNSKYWHGISYLGLGPAAHSFRDGVRWWNVKCITTYCERLGRGTPPVDGREKLTEEQRRLESLYLGLRTREGIDLSLIRRQPDRDKIIARLQAENLAAVSGDRLIPTRRGFVVADSLPLLFSYDYQ
ncbi:MAG: radical SAM family heme chaperone HemW [Deltaproteobacteria bacterium]|nr:radical SAM family heme chaperone HemW [Deltaproteobacteria bacterium]